MILPVSLSFWTLDLTVKRERERNKNWANKDKKRNYRECITCLNYVFNVKVFVRSAFLEYFVKQIAASDKTFSAQIFT